MTDSFRPTLTVLLEFPSLLGGERSLLALTDALSDRFSLRFLAPPGGPLAAELCRQGLAFHLFEFRDAAGLRRPETELIADLQQDLAHTRCDLLHGNSLTVARFLGRHRGLLPCPVTGHLRDIMKLSARAIADLAQLDRLIAVSQATADCYLQQGLPAQRVRVIHNGIDVADYEKSIEPLDLRVSLGLEEHVPIATTIGQIGPRKGQDTLVAAVISVAAEIPDWHFLLIGERFSTKQETRDFVARLEADIITAGLRERIHWLGYRDDVSRLLPQCDLLIHPARQEPFGRVLLEAAAAGVPILATQVGGTGEMLTHTSTAWLIEPNAPALLAEAILKLAHQPELRAHLAGAARHHVRSHLTVPHAAELHWRCWSEVLP